MTLKAGSLNDRVCFERRIDEPDGAGSFESRWSEHWTCAAGIKDMRGGEDVLARRLNSVKPAIITVRDCELSRCIDSNFRARDVRRGTIYNVRDVTPSRLTGFIDLLCESGTAHG